MKTKTNMMMKMGEIHLPMMILGI